MGISAHFWRPVLIAVAIIALSVLWHAWQVARQSPGARRRQAQAAERRARTLLAAAHDRQEGVRRA